MDHTVKIVCLIAAALYTAVSFKVLAAYQAARRAAPLDPMAGSNERRLLIRLMLGAPLLLLAMAGLAWLFDVPIT